MSTVSVNKVIPKDNNKLTLGNSGQAVVADGTLTLSANTKVTRMDAIQSAGDRRVIIGSNTQHLDSARGKYGTSGDLQIYHDGSNSYVEDAGTGTLILKSNQMNVNTTGDAGMISAVEGGAVQLYFGGNVKLATTSTGTSVTGKVVATGPVTTPIVTANTVNATAANFTTLQADAIDFDGDVTVDKVTANSFGKIVTTNLVTTPAVIANTFQSHTSKVADGNAVNGSVNIAEASNDAGIVMSIFGNNTNYTRISGQKSRNASVGGHTVIQDGDGILEIGAFGSDGTDYHHSGKIRFEVDGTPGNNDIPGRIVFLTTPDGGITPAEAFRISQNKTANFSGLVGINQSSPSQPVHLTDSDFAFMRFQTTAVSKTGMDVGQHQDGTGHINLRDANHIKISTGDTERVRIKDDGNVFIGTDSGSERLRVVNSSDTNYAPASSAFNTILMLKNATSGALNSASLAFATETNGEIYLSAVENSDNDAADLRFTLRDSGNRYERFRFMSNGRLENQSPTNSGNVLQDFRIDWRNENNAGIMAGIGVVRTADGNAPGAFVIRTSTNVDSSSNNGDGEISEKFRVAANGDLTATDTSIASNSDSRLKTNIADYDYDLEKFKLFEPKTFDWKQPSLHGDKTGQRGFIAQDLEAVDNYWVDRVEVPSDSEDFQYLEDEDIYYTENSKSIPEGKKVGDLYYKARFAKTGKLGQKDAMYISVIKQLISKIETLETKVATLEDK